MNSLAWRKHIPLVSSLITDRANLYYNLMDLLHIAFYVYLNKQCFASSATMKLKGLA